MADERRDYAILISLSMREEAEVMASALRAEGIDAFVAPTHHSYLDWGYIIALGGMQVFVPRQRIAEAKEIIRERIKEAAADPQGEPISRRDRYKVWLVILGYVLLVTSGWWLAILSRNRIAEWITYEASDFDRNMIIDMCVGQPDRRVLLPGTDEVVPCSALMQ